MDNTRLTFEARSKEDLGGASVAVRATFRVVSHEVEMAVDPVALTGPMNILRLVLNPHRRLGETEQSYDFLLEGDLDTMELIGAELSKKAREYRAMIRKGIA